MTTPDPLTARCKATLVQVASDTKSRIEGVKVICQMMADDDAEPWQVRLAIRRADSRVTQYASGTGSSLDDAAAATLEDLAAWRRLHAKWGPRYPAD